MYKHMKLWACLSVFLVAIVAAPLAAQQAQTLTPTPPLQSVGTDEAFLGLTTYRLWEGRAEDATGDGADETPTITMFRPQPGRANGTSVVVAPGGGYVLLAGILEGREVADWFTSRGVTAFVVRYRTGPKSRLPIPLNDGRRAMQFVRANAAAFKLDPQRIGMMGFSAGGHLSAMTAATARTSDPRATDPLDMVSSRPDFLVLGYPWLEGTVLDDKGQSQYCTFARKNCDPKAYEQYTPIRFVTNQMPPTFIYHTTTDRLVPVEGSYRFAAALQKLKVPVELHAFGTGEHGTGLGGSDPALTRWPDLLEQWLRARKLLEPAWPVRP